MFAHVLGCTVLAALLSTPMVSDSSGRTFCDRATERGDITMIETVVPQRDQATFDGEFPRRLMTVWFDKPMKVGDRILMGRYFIEHDDVRMAHGLPCTYLYSAADPRLPVVAFRCRHLARAASAQPTVVVRSVKNAIGMRELVSFQFPGEAWAHGVPTAQ
jgi:hypothetical protein